MLTSLYKPNTVKLFSQSLRDNGFSDLTIKNYLTDVRQFLAWRSDTGEESPKMYLSDQTKKFSDASLKRKASAIKKYLQIERETVKGPRLSATYLVLPMFSVVILVASVVSFINTQSDFNVQIKDAVIAKSRSYAVDNASPPAYIFGREKGLAVVLPDAPSMSSPKLFTNIESLKPVTSTAAQDQGVAEIAKGENEALIVNELINPNSFVYITPNGSSGNQILYVKIKADGYMIVGVDDNAYETIRFEWKIDNTKLYSEIL